MKTLQQVAQSIDTAIRSILEDAGVTPEGLTLRVDVFGIDYCRMQNPERFDCKLGDRPFGYTKEEHEVGDHGHCQFFADEKTCPEYVPELTAPENEEKPF